MKITVAGMGNAGTTIAADLTMKGHEVTLLKTSDSKIHNEHAEYLFKNKDVTFNDHGKINKVKLHDVTGDVKKAISSAELIIIYIQTNYHEILIDKIAPYFKENQVILFEPGYLSTAYLMKYIEKYNLTIVEAESSPIDCRITSPGKVEVLFKNVRNPIAVYPKRNLEYAKSIMSELKYNFVYRDSVVETALHNPNLIVHTIGAIMSMPRIEYTKGEYWMYKEVFTPSVWNIVESLDNEKKQVLKKLGFETIPYVDACKLRNSEDQSKDSKEVFFDYAYNSSPKGPNVVNSRYITEDVPEGLVLLESLGKHLGVKTPVCSSLIDLSSSALNVDFRSNGRNLERIGIDNLSKILNELE